KTCEEAKTQMTGNDLVGNCTEQETDDPNQVGKVISTTPGPNSSADKGSQVTIVIGKAQQQENKFAMPRVTQMTVRQAKQALAQAGLQLERVPGANGDTAAGVGRSPQAGGEGKQGDKVVLIAIGGQQGGPNGGDNGGIFGGLTGGRD